MENTIKSLFSKLDDLLKNRFFQHGLFFIAAIITIFLMGYHFGTFDQAVHIPFLKKFTDPSLYPRDGFFDLRFIHYSYFWFIFIPFYRLGILEISMFIAYFITLYFTFWSLWRLSKTIFNNNLVSLLTVICFIFPHIGFSGFPLIEFSLLNRIFVMPFLIWAIAFYLEKRYYAAFFILGLMYNFHVISVNFVLAMMLFDIFFKFKNIGIKKTIIMLTLFILTAMPVLVWKFGGEGIDLTVNREWFDVLNQGFLFHLFNLFSLNIKLTALTLSSISMIILFWLITKNQKKSEINLSVIRFILAAIMVLIVAFFTTNLGLYPATIIVQSQITRIGIFILLFTYFYYINFIVTLFQSKKISSLMFLFLISAVLFSISPVIILIAHLVYKQLSSKVIKPLIFLNLIFFITLIIIGNTLDVWQPGIHIFSRNNSQTEIEKWIAQNTPKDSLIITPPYTWWFYNAEWRVLSERSNLVSLSDLLEVAFSPRHLKWWQPRFEDVAPGAITQFKGDVFDNIKITKIAFGKLKTEDFARIAIKYKARYLVVEKINKYNFPLIYENNKYSVYQLTRDN